MLKSLLLLTLCTLVCQASFADSCPSVTAIKNNTLGGWKMYDSDDGAPLSAKRIALFQKNAEQFVLAEWAQQKNGMIHCYYRDHNGANLEAYLAKDHLMPVKSHTYWYQVSGYMHCAANSEQCAFQQQVQQLARK
jgi:hypothetical protein